MTKRRQSLVFCVVMLWLIVCYLVLSSFDHCIICRSSIYGFLLPLWYVQIFLKTKHSRHKTPIENREQVRRSNFN
jgi:formate/nitrite transporter FocA (FNT family)